jgi:hypothetical protein
VTLTPKGYVYLASPYSHPDESIMEARFVAAEAATARLLRRSVWVYSPIVHCHELAKKFDLPKDFVFWQEYNFAMIRGAAKLYVLRIDGWEASKGVTAEIAYARELGIPVIPLPLAEPLR